MAYGTAPEDPTWFSEDTPRSHNPRSTVERSIAQVEGYVRDFNLDNPEVAVSVLRFANVLGADIRTPLTRALELPLVPTVFGFDPRLQFAHEEDVVRSILFAMNHRLAGTYNVAGDGLLPWSEVISMVGKRPGYLPAIGADLATLPLQRLGLIDLPRRTLRCFATAGASTTPSSRPPGSSTTSPPHSPWTVSCAPSGYVARWDGTGPSIATRATSSSSFATHPR